MGGPPSPPPPFEEDEGLTKGKKKQAQRVALKIAKNAPGAGTNVA
jgi:hypothetical protein